MRVCCTHALTHASAALRRTHKHTHVPVSLEEFAVQIQALSRDFRVLCWSGRKSSERQVQVRICTAARSSLFLRSTHPVGIEAVLEFARRRTPALSSDALRIAVAGARHARADVRGRIGEENDVPERAL